MLKAPVPYTPAVEVPQPDEAETIADLTAVHIKSMRRATDDPRDLQRAQHSKSHGLLIGRLEVLDDLDDTLAQGIFASPQTYDAVIRLSTVPGEILPDAFGTPRGFALKLIGVDGERLPGSEGATTQDFIMVNMPAFGVSSLKAMIPPMKGLAAISGRMEGLKMATAAVARTAEAVIEGAGGNAPGWRAIGGEQPRHPLGETYFSQVPILYGPYMAKLSLVPVSRSLTTLTAKRIDTDSDKIALRKLMNAHFETQGGEWELRVQLCRDLEAMPIENSTKVWSDEDSPWQTVARLTIDSQTAWSDERSHVIDDGMSFNPWHGITVHRPLGWVMRARKPVYEASVRTRSQSHGLTITEPDSVDYLFASEPAEAEVFYP
jgi:hypothetical protein